MPFGKRKTPKAADAGSPSHESITAKREEKSSKTSVFNTLKRTFQKIKHPFLKSVISAKTPEELEKALASRSTGSITARSRRMTALLYVKIIQLFGAKGSQLVLKGNPQEAATQLKNLANILNKRVGFAKKYQYTYKKLLALAKKIETIYPKIWGALINFFDLAFDSSVGSAMLSGFLNVKNVGSNQKLLDYINKNKQEIKKNSKTVVPTQEGIWFDNLKNKKDSDKREEKKRLEQEQKQRKGADPTELYKDKAVLSIAKYLDRIREILFGGLQGDLGQGALSVVSTHLAPLKSKISDDMVTLRYKIQYLEKQGKTKDTDGQLKYYYDDYQAHNTLSWVIGVILKVLNNEPAQSIDLNRAAEYFHKVGKEILPIPTNEGRVKEITDPANEILNLLIPIFSQYSKNCARKVVSRHKPTTPQQPPSSAAHHSPTVGTNLKGPHGAPSKPTPHNTGEQKTYLNKQKNTPHKLDTESQVKMYEKRTGRTREWQRLEDLAKNPTAQPLNAEDEQVRDNFGQNQPEVTIEDLERELEDF